MRIAGRINSKADELVERLVIARQNRDQAEAACAALERELAEMMEDGQMKSMTSTTPVGKYQTTYVRSTTAVVDEVGLRKALGARVYDKFTIRKLDRKKLETALDEGTVLPEQVSPYVTEKVGRAYIKLTEKKSEA